ncbi:MAG TPA: hypothetical protein VMU96_02450 [Casimicrobiaceae bacterium]|nr:hypothetical protein [Casimicrobiaceae bacterium]
MPFAYYARLSPARQRIYRKSDAIERLDPPAGVHVGVRVAGVREGLTRDDRAAVQAASQGLIDALAAGYRVPKIRIRVLAQRPADETGELHGLYEPEDDGEPAQITIWMRTAARRDVVAFKTFLRTLVHELCHHLDYELFKLPETFHTEGFYKRESTLANALFAQESALGGPG